MESNYWTRPGAAIRHGFIRTAGPGENYWTHQTHMAWFVQARAAMVVRTRANLLRKAY